MKNYFNSMKKIFNRVKESLSNYFSEERKGTIDFTTGNYEILVKTDIYEGEEVEFLIEDCDKTTCSYLPANKIEIEQGEDGFVLKALIESNEVKIHWKIK